MRCDAVLEKPVSISAGKDDFEAILLASHRAIGASRLELPCVCQLSIVLLHFLHFLFPDFQLEML